MVLIVSDRKDLQAYVVMLELDALGVEHGLFNVADFPTAASVALTFGAGADHSRLTLDGGATVNASSVRAVWFRKPDLPRLSEQLDASEREFAFNEIRAGLQGLYNVLELAYWISPLEHIRAASNKPAQLRLASRLGMTVPRTIFTNDAALAREFIESVGGRVIYKPVGDRYLSTRTGPWEPPAVVAEIFTTLLDAAVVEAGLARLPFCPALFQELIEKEVDLRVTVVGQQVFAAAIHSQARADTAVDWRRGDPYAMPHRVHELPPAVAQHCRAIVQALGLQFGAIDMIKDRSGRYVFLEINPNGHYGWIEDLTGLGISKAIAEQLAAHARAPESRGARDAAGR
jgi:glutathione synthase/RimK-type ligase-like ATP-grasp enzyme